MNLMDKATYITKLAATVITDNNTVGEAKKAARDKKALERFWKKAALAYVLETEGIDLAAEEVNWKMNRFDFNLKPTGTVKIEVYICDDRVAPKYSNSYIIPKRFLLK